MNIAQLLHKLRVIANLEIVVPLLPEMIRLADQSPRYPLLQGFQRFRQRVPLRFAKPEVNMFGHHDVANQLERHKMDRTAHVELAHRVVITLDSRNDEAVDFIYIYVGQTTGDLGGPG